MIRLSVGLNSAKPIAELLPTGFKEVDMVVASVAVVMDRPPRPANRINISVAV
jgi:hypothetical protein